MGTTETRTATATTASRATTTSPRHRARLCEEELQQLPPRGRERVRRRRHELDPGLGQISRRPQPGTASPRAARASRRPDCTHVHGWSSRPPTPPCVCVLHAAASYHLSLARATRGATGRAHAGLAQTHKPRIDHCQPRRRGSVGLARQASRALVATPSPRRTPDAAVAAAQGCAPPAPMPRSAQLVPSAEHSRVACSALTPRPILWQNRTRIPGSRRRRSAPPLQPRRH